MRRLINYFERFHVMPAKAGIHPDSMWVLLLDSWLAVPSFLAVLICSLKVHPVPGASPRHPVAATSCEDCARHRNSALANESKSNTHIESRKYAIASPPQSLWRLSNLLRNQAT